MEDYIRIEVKSITKPMKLFISCYFYDIYLGNLSQRIKPIFFCVIIEFQILLLSFVKMLMFANPVVFWPLVYEFTCLLF